MIRHWNLSFPRPCPFFDYILAFGTMVPVREDTITANGDTWTTDPKTYLTNGRYIMAERKPDEIIVCQKFDKYWDNASTKIDTIEFKLLADENVAYAAYQTDAGIICKCQSHWARWRQLWHLRIISRADFSAPIIYDFNVTKAPLDNAEVRKALTLAIDRDYIVTQVTKQNQIPAYAWVPEGIVDVNGKTFRENGGDFVEKDYAKAIEQRPNSCLLMPDIPAVRVSRK